MRSQVSIPYSFFGTGGDGQGAHVLASLARSGALGVPAKRPRAFGARPRLV